eukprot:s362_g7.t1
MDCAFARWFDKELGVAEYLGGIVKEVHGGFGGIGGYDYCPVGLFYAREVPGPLVFKCALALSDDKTSFDAAFTTLAGREIFRASQTLLPALLTMRDLIAMATGAGKADGLLQSQNQEVSVLLDGYSGTTPLCPQTVLWSKQLPRVGLLQFH